MSCFNNQTIKMRARLEYACVVWAQMIALQKMPAPWREYTVTCLVVLPNFKNQDLRAILHRATLAWKRRRSKAIYLWHLVNRRGAPTLANHLPTPVQTHWNYFMRNPCSILSSLLVVLSMLIADLLFLLLLLCGTNRFFPCIFLLRLSTFTGSHDFHLITDCLLFGLSPFHPPFP